MPNNILITMSGGTTTVINATLVGIIKAARKCDKIDRIYAGYPGIIGTLNEDIVDLTDISEAEIEKLYYTPASGFIGTTRVRPLDEFELKSLEKVFEAHNVKYFLNIGGNGTIKQTMQISKNIGDRVKCIALPKTVDNDLGDMEFEKVLYTPGFPSCANYWKFIARIMNLENLGAYSHDKVLITQTFGRKTGFLAGCARLADESREWPLIILLPEDQKDINTVLNKIETTVNENKRAMVVMTEGYEIDELGVKHDHTGQVMYGSSNTTNAQNLVNKCMEANIQARAFVPAIDQRSNIIYTTLEDLKHAEGVGIYAVGKLLQGQSNFLTSISDNMQYISIPFTEIKDFSRQMPDKWISYDNFDVTDEYLDYVKLILGESILTKFNNIFEIKFAEYKMTFVEKKLNTQVYSR